MPASAEKAKRRDSVRMLISSSSVQYQKNLELGANPDRDLIRSEDNLHETFVSYVQALTGSSRRRIPLVWMEHSYARSVTANAAESTGRPAPKLLLVRSAPQCPDCHSEGEDDETIDIESVDTDPTPPLALEDLPQCEKPLEESELTVEDESKPDWEDRLNSLPWNSAQSHLLNGALNAIANARVAILTAGKNGAKRAAARGGAARAFRELLAEPPVRWQTRLVQWLHNALMEHLPTPWLSCYKEIVLTLKSKIPVLVERMIQGHSVTGRVRGFENGASGPMIASASGAPTDPNAPILLLMPSGRDKRDARWAERLRSVTQVFQVHSHQSGWLPNLPVSACLSQLVALAKTRVSMLKLEYPHRPLVLVGQGAGAAIAVQLAVSISGVTGVVCLGLPLLTAEGPRGDPEDSLLSLPCPILFVIGQNASQSSQQDVESLRLKLRARSKLVVAGSADDLLRLPRIKRQLEGVTQRMLECAIADEVGDFLTCLSQWDDALDSDLAPGSPTDNCENELKESDLATANAVASITNNLSSSYGINASMHSTNTSPNPLPPPSAGISPSPLNLPPPGNVAPQSAKRKGGKNITMPKTKKPKTVRAIASTSPLKGRGMALYQVNNPPPEGTSISLGVLLNSPHINENNTASAEEDSPTQSSKLEPASFIQISNNRLTKSFPFSGNGPFADSQLSSSGIKVLENIPIKMPKVMTTKAVSGSISGMGNTPLILPRKTDNKQIKMTSAITSANIMDIPIIFADDEKVSPQKTIVSHMSTPSPGIKSIIINKQPIGNSTNVSPTKNLVQLKVPSNNTSLGIGPVTTTPTICFKQNVSNSGVKFTKLIVTKRSPEKSVNVIGTPNTNDGQRKFISKPIIVKSKTGPMTAFKVLPGGILHKSSNAISQPRQLIIKKASGISGIKTNAVRLTNKHNTSTDSQSDKAIEAAVASITKDQEMLDGL